MPYNREEQLDHAARWLRERSQSDSQPLTADQAEDLRESLYGVRVGLITPEKRLEIEMGRRYGVRPETLPQDKPVDGVYRFEIGQRVHRLYNAYAGRRCLPEEEFVGKVIDRYDSDDVTYWWPIYEVEGDDGERRVFGEVVLVAV